MSIRLRLTLLYTGILALTLVVFGALLYVAVNRVTMASLKKALEADAGRVQANARQVGLNEFWLATDKFTAKTTYLQVREYDGDVRPAIDPYGRRVPMGDAGQETMETGRKQFELVVLPNDGGRLLVYSVPLEVNGQPIGVLQAARPLADHDASLATLSRNLIIGTILASLLAFGIGWMLAGAALRPINRITQTARAIGAERDFERRVPYTHAHDEVGRLASTFNTMLAQLGGAYSQVEEALRAQRRFVADASHELRTPLTSIRGNIALLGRKPPISEEDRAAVLADAEEESERLMRLVNDLLLLARADAGRPLQREAVALGALIDDVCRQARVLAPDREVGCEDAGDLAALGDRDALKQVLLVLLDNALKFTRPGGRIEVGVGTQGERVELSVRDDGPGIAPEALPHIFERFYRGDAARSGSGTGLGLAIAKQLTEAQGGVLAVRSEPGRGSTFTVSLPLAPAAGVFTAERAEHAEGAKL